MPTVEIIDKDHSGDPFTAETFMEYLRPSKDHWHEVQPTTTDHHNFPMYLENARWAFRGHWKGHGNAEDDWKLTPSSWRNNPQMQTKLATYIADMLSNGLLENDISKGNAWQNMEFSMLRAFLKALKVYGYPLDLYVDETMSSMHLPFPQKIKLTVTALAQHHGIPTRFLDWTLNPLNAAYFSVGNQFRKGDSNAICVWALRLNSPLIGRGPLGIPHIPEENAIITPGRPISTQYSQFGAFEPSDDRAIDILVREQPKHENEFLKAQQGLFTEMVSHESGSVYTQFFDTLGRWPDLERVIRTRGEGLDKKSTEICAATLRKVVLDINEADKLLLLLRREGFNRSYLMPTLDNLAADALESWENSFKE